jgi:hypothetical protein
MILKVGGSFTSKHKVGRGGRNIVVQALSLPVEKVMVSLIKVNRIPMNIHCYLSTFSAQRPEFAAGYGH